MNTATIRRSPIVLIRNFIFIEVLAFLLYFLVTGHGSYKSEFYNQLFLSDFISYDTAKLFFLSGAQLLITIYAFFSWYYELYEIRPGMVSHSRGVFWKRKKNFPLEKSMTVTFSSGPVGKSLHYGSIHLESRHYSSIVLATISRPQGYLRIIEKNIDPNMQSFVEKPDISQLASQEEHEQLEFKSSLRFDRRMNQLNRELEKAAMKTVAAFLNSKGGYLVIGMDDSKKPLGLRDDYETLQRKDGDGLENHFTQTFNAMIGPEFRHLVKLWFYEMEGLDVCVVQVAPSSRPVYLKLNDSERFYVRTGNITTDLKFSEVEAYTRSHWSRR
ncbi:MAG: RNA-binding domain-containing protein [Minisyncoccia bacterium]